MPKGLKISWSECELDPKVTIIKFSGEMDASSVDEIRDELANILEERELAYLIGDFTDVTFISSPALGELMGCKKRAQAKNGDLVIIGLMSDIEKKLKLMGAHKVFDIFHTLRDAIHKFNWEYENKPEVVTVKFPSSLDYVPGLRGLVSEIARIRGFDKKDTYRIETIVDEVCNNAIEHGSSGENSVVTLRCAVDKEKVDLIIKDSGAGAEKLKNAISHLSDDPTENLTPRGRGLPIVAMLADSLKIESNNGTEVHVTKYRK